MPHRAQKLLAIAPNVGYGDEEPPSPAASASREVIGPATCGCWVGAGCRTFASGHQTGQVLVWALPSEQKDTGAFYRPCFMPRYSAQSLCPDLQDVPIPRSFDGGVLRDAPRNGGEIMLASYAFMACLNCSNQLEASL